MGERAKGDGRVLTLSLISVLRGARDNLRMVFWQPFAVSLGLDMTSVGALESVMELFKNVLEPSLGAIADSIGRKRLIVAREFLTVLASFAFFLAWSWHLLFVGVVLIGVANAFVSVWSAVVAESAEEGKLATIYGLLGTFYTGAGIAGSLGAGYITDAFGYQAVCAVFAALALATLSLVRFRLRETIERSPKRIDWRSTTAALLRAFNPPKKLRGFYLAMVVDLFAFSTGVRILNGMLAKGYGCTPGMIGLCISAMTVTWAVGQIPLSRLADRFGYARFMAASQFLACVMLGIIIYSKEFEYVLLAHFILGAANALWMPSEQAWIADNVSPSERAGSIAGFSAFRGFIAIPAPILGGFLFDSFGFDVPIAVNLLLAFLDGLLILLLVKERPKGSPPS